MVKGLMCLLLLQPVAVPALGLDKLVLNSALNQVFDAMIPFVGLQENELAEKELHVGIYKTEGWPDDPQQRYDLSTKIVADDDVRPYLKLTSEHTIRELILNFILDVYWRGGQISREYSLVLDPAFSESGKGK